MGLNKSKNLEEKLSEALNNDKTKAGNFLVETQLEENYTASAAEKFEAQKK